MPCKYYTPVNNVNDMRHAIQHVDEGFPNKKRLCCDEFECRNGEKM